MSIFSCVKCFWLKEKKANQNSIMKLQKSEKKTWREMSQQHGWAGRLQRSWVTYLSYYVRFSHVSKLALVCCYEKEPANHALWPVRCNERGILSLPPPSDYLNEEFSITSSLMKLGLVQDPGVRLTSHAALLLSSAEQEENKRFCPEFQRFSSETLRWSSVTG